MESLLFLLQAVYKFDTCKFHINSYNIVKVIDIWQCGLHLWTKAYTPCSLFSAATGTGTQHSAVPCHWHSGILAAPPPPNDKQVIIGLGNWRTLGWMWWHYPPHNLWWPLWCAHLCGLATAWPLTCIQNAKVKNVWNYTSIPPKISYHET
jgi:hypothetical protein